MTLTGMLEKRHKEDDFRLSPEGAKEIIREWLKEVGLPDYQAEGLHYTPFNATESLRELLIILVDEP